MHVLYLMILFSLSKSLIFLLVFDIIYILFLIESIFNNQDFWKRAYWDEIKYQEYKNLKKNDKNLPAQSINYNYDNYDFSLTHILSPTFFKVFFRDESNSYVNFKLIGFCIFISQAFLSFFVC